MKINGKYMITELVQDFYDDINKDLNHRYKSWEHCYQYFNSKETIDIDLGSLHLGFYLASWGMYRGSSQLLWKDYKVHYDVIKYLVERKKLIQPFDVFNKSTEEMQIDELLNLRKEIIKIYQDKIKSVKGQCIKFSPSETLVTKILLGVYGCIPAFDRLFNIGLHVVNSGTYSYNKKTIRYLYNFCKENEIELKKIKEEIFRKNHVEYTIMKIVDMYFWMVGMKNSND